MQVFRQADVDGSGSLSRHEFRDALKAAELGLTRKDINLIMSHVDVDGDGVITYAEFAPVCLEVMVERMKDELQHNAVLTSAGTLDEYLLSAFQSIDPQGDGLLPSRMVKSALTQLSYEFLGLNSFQILTLMAQAPKRPDGLVDYVKFTPRASAYIVSLHSADSLKARMAAIQKISAEGGVAAIRQLDYNVLRDALTSAFQAADVDGTGQLREDQVMEVLQSVNSLSEELVLSEQQMAAMFMAIDSDESGAVDWFELINFLCDAIEHVEKEMYIQQVAAAAEQQQGDDGGGGDQ